MPKQLIWIKLKVGESAPSARLGHTLVDMGNSVYILYGGIDANSKMEGKIIPNNQVYKLTIKGKGECVWTLVDCEGEEIPQARTNHSATKLSGNEMFVFGGYFSSKQRFNDVHILKVGQGKTISLLFLGSGPFWEATLPFGRISRADFLQFHF